ncbi:unnamed protein product [Penicillium salamii]|uniref:Uncharacterized protein n=1 Tax=Penicillium salamii TaxID=1612424 RepID=A0A9W4IA20_9EURO|nr:unnamed protein product [Penicillium salamii]CAG7948855.1 unnamed protein product [Penicillium salamii]CAG8268988.1 unnamed protein product [Penicillium salamii]CAG8351474.1 unnamed protein product [Penicillium salamii]
MPHSRQSEVEHWERKLYDYRERHFELSARVHLSHLVFETGFRRRMDGRQNICRLERMMKIQGCQRLIRENHVPVIVPRTHWQDYVRPRSGSGIIPSLDVELDYRLRAYDHENLITAARSVLDHDNQWWIVDVYLTDGEDEDHRNEADSVRDMFIQSLKERYPNDNRPPDGLIYERINFYEGHLNTPRDPLAANNWWAVLEAVAGSKKGKYLKQFFKHETLHQRLNSLLVVPGLWEGMRIGLLHKVTAMHSDEPIACYWMLIYSIFSRLVGGRDELLPLIDGVTVDLLQSRVPKVSSKDLIFLKDNMNKGRLFPNFSEAARLEIWARLTEIDYPIPTLKTFFKDRLYLEVAQCVMKRLFVQPRSEKITIDQGVYGKYDTPVPVSMALRQQWLRNDLLEFWRFSFQYGFEMTNHQRLKWSKDGEPEDLFDPQSSESSLFPRQDIWRHFFALVRARTFQAPALSDSSFATMELPSPRPCDYPEDISEEIDVAKRCGKPYSNTVEADRFALSAESLQQSQIPVRVTAGFLRQSVFKAFFGYLWNSNGQTHDGDPAENNTDIQNYGEQLNQEDFGRNVAAGPDMDVDSGSITENPLAASTALTHNVVVPAPAADQMPSFCVMKITVGETTQSLELPFHESFLRDFSSGLFNNSFSVQRLDGRSIAAGECYSHYLNYPTSQLHAKFKEGQYPEYESTSSQMGIGSKRQRISEQEQHMASAKAWLQDQISKLKDLHDSDEGEL